MLKKSLIRIRKEIKNKNMKILFLSRISEDHEKLVLEERTLNLRKLLRKNWKERRKLV